LPALCSLFFAGIGSAQNYPVRAVRVIAPSAPGGATDVLTRIISLKLHEKWEQAVVVENRIGANSNIGAEFAARAAPDGYTLLVGGSPHAINMSLYRNLGYDFAQDLTAIGGIATFPSLITVHPSLPIKTVKELISLARSRPGELNFGSPGNGSPNHLAMELFKSMARVNMIHIPYKGGSGQMVNDLLAGQVQLASIGLPPSMQYVKAGRLHAIAVTSTKRSPLLPEVPTVSEAGLQGFDVTSWNGLFGPVGLPRELIAKLNADVTAALATPDMKERLAVLGAEPMPMPTEEFGRYVREEIVKWGKVVKASGAKID
jgi:tripartite-type tricarboxylate transporter receptor subunit TctC